VTEVRRASGAGAGRHAAWIAVLPPWSTLGYSVAGIARFLRRSARAGGLLVASAAAKGPVLGVLALQEGVLLGNFVALLVVRPEAAGQGIGRALMARAEALTAVKRRWLFVSADAENRDALAFYRKLGFRRVGKLPDLIRPGRLELLLRKAATAPPAATAPVPGAAPGRSLRR
jgi:ribosomal-protein-alanine N-acetyltransferase